jgi:hypothetical protein
VTDELTPAEKHSVAYLIEARPFNEWTHRFTMSNPDAAKGRLTVMRRDTDYPWRAVRLETLHTVEDW